MAFESIIVEPMINTLWFVLQVAGGHLGIPWLLITIWCSRLRRLPTFYNFLLVWVVSSIVSCMLYYADFNQSPSPPFSLCLAQATMIHAIPLMGSLASFALVYDCWKIMLVSKSPISPQSQSTALFVAPWLGFLAASLWAFLVGLTHPENVRRKLAFYCSIQSEALSNVLGMLTVIMLSITLVYGAKVTIQLYRNWQKLKRNVSDPSKFQSGIHSPYLVLRIAVFALYILMSLGVMMLFVAGDRFTCLQLLFGSIPLAVLFIFGTQAEITWVWIKLLVPVHLIPRALSKSRLMCVEGDTVPSLLPSHHASTAENSFHVWRDKYLNQDRPYPTPKTPLKAYLDGRPAASYGTIPNIQSKNLVVPQIHITKLNLELLTPYK